MAEVFCDGACIGNPGPGGYGVIVRMPGRPVERDSGGLARTTNNQMELTARHRRPDDGRRGWREESIRVSTDSEYLVNGMNELDRELEAQGLEDDLGHSGQEPGDVGGAGRSAQRS